MQGGNKLEYFLSLSLSWKEEFCHVEEHAMHYGQNSCEGTVCCDTNLSLVSQYDDVI
jgi:hypothetical protein